jgi:hypothetical protein
MHHAPALSGMQAPCETPPSSQRVPVCQAVAYVALES